MKWKSIWHWQTSAAMMLLTAVFLGACGMQQESGTMPVQPPEIKTTEAEPSETEIQGIEIPETESRTAEFIYELPIDPYEGLTVDEISKRGKDYVIRASFDREIWESEITLTMDKCRWLKEGQLMRGFYRGMEVFTVIKSENEDIYILTDSNGSKPVKIQSSSYLHYSGKYEENRPIRIDVEREWVISADTEVLAILPDDSEDGRGMTALTMEEWYSLYQTDPFSEWSRISILENDKGVIRVCPAFSYEHAAEIRDMDDQYLAENEVLYRIGNGEFEKLEDGSFRLVGDMENPRPIILTTEEKSWVDAGCSLYGIDKGAFTFTLRRVDDHYRSGVPLEWEGLSYEFWQKSQPRKVGAILSEVYESQKKKYNLDVEQTYYLVDNYSSYVVYWVVEELQAEFILPADMMISAVMYYYYGEGAGRDDITDEERMWTLKRYWDDWYEENLHTGQIWVKVRDGEVVQIWEGYAP